MADNPAPQIVNNRYVLMPKPKAGGMSDVYAATDVLEGGRKVAVKLLRYGSGDEAILAESFRRETDALRRLEHPNVVKLFDAGVDPASSRSYLVLEWLDVDLAQYVAAKPLDGWDDFYALIGLPILKGLEFAHGRRFSHRDVKPSNILLNENGVPKLADFGIAKLHAFMTPGLTLAEFASRPYTPPEAESGRYTFTRDIYGFAVVAVGLLTGHQLKERTDVERALEDADLPPDVYACLERCLDLDPARRPVHAGVLLAELESIQQLRGQDLTSRRTCWVGVRKADASKLRQSLGLLNDAELRSRLSVELKGPCAIEPYVFKGQVNDSQAKPQYLIHASTCRIHATVEHSGDHLFVFNAWAASQSECERARELCWEAPFVLRLGPPQDRADGEETIRLLQLGVEQHQAELKVLRAQREEQRLFSTWGSLLRARLELERERTPPIRFSARTVDNQRIDFTIEAPARLEWESEPWRIRLADGSFVKGELEIVGESVALSVSQGDPEQVPSRGRLEFDSSAAEAALNRQQFVLDTVRFGRAVHPTLRELLVDPSLSRDPESIGAVEVVHPNLDDAKKDALVRALGVQDFVVVEGPPGTGKTTFIAELVLQLLRRDPNARILLTSQTHVALDNALERIRSREPELAMVRVASRHTSGRVAASIKPITLEHALERWRRDSLQSAEEFVEAWAADRGVSKQDTHVGLLLQRLISMRTRLSTLEIQLVAVRAELLAERDAREASREREGDQQELLENEVSRLGEEMRIQRKLLKELQDQIKKGETIGEELLTLSDEELRKEIKSYLPDSPTARQIRELIELQNDWADRFGKTNEFAVALLTASNVVAGTCIGVMNVKGGENLEYDYCILDEASKATPTEVLVPLARSRRFIVVGDPKQLSPFQDPELQDKDLLEKYRISPDDAKRSLLDILIESLPASCRTRLTIQHRMVKQIGDLVSNCFYDGQLQSTRDKPDQALRVVLPKPVTWISTSALENRFEERGVGIANAVEVSEIVKVLDRIQFMAGNAGRKYSVVLLSGYAAQRAALQRHVAHKRASLPALEIEVNTVDAFQGREADIAVYSVTRSNKEGGVGFLREEQRINVALSRGRDYLVIVGDHTFCRARRIGSPLKLVADYVEANPDSCAKLEAAP